MPLGHFSKGVKSVVRLSDTNLVSHGQADILLLIFDALNFSHEFWGQHLLVKKLRILEALVGLKLALAIGLTNALLVDCRLLAAQVDRVGLRTPARE